MIENFWLFSYGTLRQANVQRSLFGREVQCIEDALSGFELGTVKITDPSVIEKSGSDQHHALRKGAEDDMVPGAALLINEADLEAADRYEAENYVRVPVILDSGRNAFAYVLRERAAEMTSHGPVDFVEPDIALLVKLLPVARRIFTATFAKNYDPAAFERFCDEVYSLGGVMSRDFTSPDVQWLVAVANGCPIGYAKLTPLRAPAEDAQAGAMELQQIYILPDWHGSGIADRLATWALETAKANGAPEIYLTVFDHNERAKRFYTRYGFSEVGRCTFQLGDRIDDDRIWRRDLV